MINGDISLTFPERLTSQQILDIEERTRLLFGLERGYVELRTQKPETPSNEYILIIRK